MLGGVIAVGAGLKIAGKTAKRAKRGYGGITTKRRKKRKRRRKNKTAF